MYKFYKIDILCKILYFYKQNTLHSQIFVLKYYYKVIRGEVMADNIFYENGKEGILKFVENEFPNFPQKLMAQFINFFTSISFYEEEGTKLRPCILFTNCIESVLKGIKKSYKLPVFADDNENLFRTRMKSLIPFCKHNWTIYVEIKEDAVNYGICKCLNSIKDKDFNTQLFGSNFIQERADKINAFIVKPLSTFCINLRGIKNTNLNINFGLETKKVVNFKEEIEEFVDASFGKLRTTNKKMAEIKTLYLNIFENVLKNVHGCICVVVDKDYVDKGFLGDGIWLEEPIAFSKLFTQSKSYSEEKLLGISELFIDMLNYDGITVVDNAGRIRAYNVFVESDASNNILGGARKRAAFTVINSQIKKIRGVYFQSQEGELFYQRVRSHKKTK